MKALVVVFVALFAFPGCSGGGPTVRASLQVSFKSFGSSPPTTSAFSFVTSGSFAMTGFSCAQSANPDACYCSNFPLDPFCAQYYCNKNPSEPRCNPSPCRSTTTDPGLCFSEPTGLASICSFASLSVCAELHACDNLATTGASFVCDPQDFCATSPADPRCTKIFGFGPSPTAGGFNAYLKPSAVGDFNCFAIVVGGPALSGSSCADSSTSPVQVVAGGALFSGFTPDSNIQIEIPSGPETLYLIGFQSEANACVPLSGPGTLNKDHLSDPYLIGYASAILPPGTATVPIQATLGSSTPVIRSCVGPLFSQLGNFGPPTSSGSTNASVHILQ